MPESKAHLHRLSRALMPWMDLSFHWCRPQFGCQSYLHILAVLRDTEHCPHRLKQHIAFFCCSPLHWHSIQLAPFKWMRGLFFTKAKVHLNVALKHILIPPMIQLLVGQWGKGSFNGSIQSPATWTNIAMQKTHWNQWMSYWHVEWWTSNSAKLIPIAVAVSKTFIQICFTLPWFIRDPLHGSTLAA